MIPHETIPIFGVSWWQSNIITIFVISLVLFLGKRSNQSQRIQIANYLGVTKKARHIDVIQYLFNKIEYQGSYIKTSKSNYFCENNYYFIQKGSKWVSLN